LPNIRRFQFIARYLFIAARRSGESALFVGRIAVVEARMIASH